MRIDEGVGVRGPGHVVKLNCQGGVRQGVAVLTRPPVLASIRMHTRGLEKRFRVCTNNIIYYLLLAHVRPRARHDTETILRKAMQALGRVQPTC